MPAAWNSLRRSLPSSPYIQVQPQAHRRDHATEDHPLGQAVPVPKQAVNDQDRQARADWLEQLRTDLQETLRKA